MIDADMRSAERGGESGAAASDRNRPGGFNVVELVIVIVVLGVLAALAIPRISAGANRNAEEQLKHDLQILRTAIDLYHQDHGHFPAGVDTGFVGGEAGTCAALIRHLTMYSDAAGRVATEPSGVFRFGPYLQRGVPPCPVAGRPNAALVHVVTGAEELPSYTPLFAEHGWVYNCTTGYIAANSDLKGSDRVRYDRY